MSYAPLTGRASWRSTVTTLALDGLFYIRTGLFMLALASAVRLLLPGSTVSSSPGYAWFAVRGSDGFWACWVIAETAGHAWAIRCRDSVSRCASAGFSAFVQCGAAWGLWQSNDQSLGYITRATVAYLALCLLFRNRAAPPADRMRDA